MLRDQKNCICVLAKSGDYEVVEERPIKMNWFFDGIVVNY